MIRRLLLVLSFVLPLGLVGCAHRTPPSDHDLRLQAATHAFGGGYDYLLVESAGEVADTAFVQYSRTFGPSELARELAVRLRPGANAPTRMMVTGAHQAKTLQVLTDALSLLEGTRLPRLELLYVGDPALAGRAREAVEARGARFHFAPFAD